MLLRGIVAGQAASCSACSPPLGAHLHVGRILGTLAAWDHVGGAAGGPGEFEEVVAFVVGELCEVGGEVDRGFEVDEPGEVADVLGLGWGEDGELHARIVAEATVC